jgi:hypothetical protein
VSRDKLLTVACTPLPICFSPLWCILASIFKIYAFTRVYFYSIYSHSFLNYLTRSLSLSILSDWVAVLDGELFYSSYTLIIFSCLLNSCAFYYSWVSWFSLYFIYYCHLAFSGPCSKNLFTKLAGSFSSKALYDDISLYSFSKVEYLDIRRIIFSWAKRERKILGRILS